MSCFDLTHAPVATAARAAATGPVTMSTRPGPEGSRAVEIATRRCPHLRVVWDLRELTTSHLKKLSKIIFSKKVCWLLVRRRARQVRSVGALCFKTSDRWIIDPYLHGIDLLGTDRYGRFLIFYDLYDLARVACWDPYNLHDPTLPQVFLSGVRAMQFLHNLPQRRISNY